MEKKDLLHSIKSTILEAAPGAKVMLFGSRAYGVPTDESDWDILILTQQQVNPLLKRKIQDALFPISLHISAFINTVTVQENEWNSSPRWYSLHQAVMGKAEEI